MSFCISANISNPARINTQKKRKDTLSLEPIKLQDKCKRFLYAPSILTHQTIESIQPKTPAEYLKENSASVMLPIPRYEQEEVVFDSVKNKWVIVKQSEVYKY